MDTTTQTRDIFLTALKNASVELDTADLGLVAELATRLAQEREDPHRFPYLSGGSVGRRAKPPGCSRSAGLSDREAKP